MSEPGPTATTTAPAAAAVATSMIGSNYSVSVVVQQVASHYKEVSLCEGRDVVICLGRTQAGKSTLYNSLVHGMLKWCESDKGERLLPVKVNEGYPVASVGDNCFSETVYPHAFALPDGKVFLDTRGFFDTSIDPSAEAAAAILTDIAVRKARSVKVLWLQPYPLLKSGGVADLDAIGGVLNKVVNENTPILFLFNKDFSLDHSANRSLKKIVNEVMDHEPGDSEENWPKFQEIALNAIEGTIKHIIDTDSSKKEKLLAALRGRAGAEMSGIQSDDALSMFENDPAFEHAEERTQYLCHFSQSLESKRVQFIDPRFEQSISWLRDAIDRLPPALGEGSGSAEGDNKALNFTNYCNDLVTFRTEFNTRLKEFIFLLKGQQLMKSFHVDQTVIDSKMAELKKHEEALNCVMEQKDVAIYQHQYVDEMMSSAMASNLRELERIKKVIGEIENEIKNLEEREPFVDEVSVHAFSFFRSPRRTVVYDKEPFLRFEEDLPEMIDRDKVVSLEPPRFEVRYKLLSNGFHIPKVIPPFLLSLGLSIGYKASGGSCADPFANCTLPMLFLIMYGSATEKNISELKKGASSLGDYFTHRHFRGSVNFFIDSKVHNKEQIDEMKRELQIRVDSLERLKQELDSSKEKKTLTDVIHQVIDKTKGDIEKLQWVKAFQERLNAFLERKVKSSSDGEHDEMKVEDIIEGCRPIVEDFFKQKDGIMIEFLRALSSKEETKEISDISSLMEDNMICAKGLEPYHQSIATLLEQWKQKH